MIGIKAPICAVSGSQYLTPSGWVELRNSIDLDVPFRLFRDEGRTFLQVNSISIAQLMKFFLNFHINSNLIFFLSML